MASEYGWTIDQIFDLTREEVEALLKAIYGRKNREFEFQAKLHGAKIRRPLPKQIITPEALPEKFKV